MKKSRTRITKSEFILIGIIVLYSVFVGIMNPAFLNIDSLFDLIRSSSTVMIVAMGLLVIMLSGGIDVSFMSIALFGSYTATKLLILFGITSIPVAMGLSMSMGLCLGITNALLVTWLRLPPFIITLGTQCLFHGAMATFIGAKTYGAGALPPSFAEFGSSTLFSLQVGAGTVGLSSSSVFVALAVVLTWFLIYKTMLGRGIVALGNSEESAVRAGFRPALLRLVAYGYTGILAGCAGIVYVCQVTAVYPDKLVGDELSVIAAAVIGGASINGGKGKILGVILGVTVIYLLKGTLIFLGLSSSWNNLFVGSILIASIATNAYQEMRKNRQQLIFNM